MTLVNDVIVREFDLFLTAGRGLPLLINVNQFDSGEEWHFTLYKGDGTQYIPSTGAIVGIKSDGLGIINSGTVVDGKVVIVETQQMTAAVGKATFELTIDSGTHGTANFHVLVEPKPGNNADLSDSDVSLIQEALNAVSPLPTGGTVGQVLTKTAQGSAWSDAGTPTQEQVAEAVSDWADENITVSTGVVIDNSLSVAGAAADAKKTGDEISDLKSQITNGIPHAVKQALDNLLQNVAFKNDDGYSDDLATVHVWATAVNLLSISAVFEQGQNVICDSDSLDSLKQYLTVTASYDDGSTVTINNYTLSGNLNSATSPITVSYDGKTATFNVNVTVTLRASWDYTLGRLPSSDDGISYTNNGSNTVSLESDGIHVVGGSTVNDTVTYLPTDYDTGTSVISEHVFVITSGGSGALSNQDANGTDGCNVIFADSNIAYYKGTTRTNIMSFSENTEYKLRIEYESGVNAKVYLNDELILTQSNADRSTYYTTKNRLRVQGSASVTIKSMKWYVRS